MFKLFLYKIFYPGVKFGVNPSVQRNCIFPRNLTNLNGRIGKTKIGNNCLIRSGTTIYPGNIFGDNFITGNKVNIRDGNEIGSNVSIGTLSIIEHSVKIGNNVRIHSGAFIPEYTIIKDGAWIGPRVVITNSKYPGKNDSKDNLSGVVISERAVIGANVTILPGIKIGKNAIIGAGSVVTKNVPDNEVYIGNPAKKL